MEDEFRWGLSVMVANVVRALLWFVVVLGALYTLFLMPESATPTRIRARR